MRDADGKFWCDYCKRRSAKGGLRVGTSGGIEARRIATDDINSIFCSERCLRDALWGLDPEDDPVEQLTKRMAAADRARAADNRRRRELDDRFEDEAMDDRSRLNRIDEIINEMRKRELTRSVDNSADGKELRRQLRLIAIEAHRAW